MGEHQLRVRAAKDHVNKLIMLTCKEGHNFTPEEMSAAVSELDKAWDAWVDSLIAQRRVRDRLIAELMDRLADKDI